MSLDKPRWHRELLREVPELGEDFGLDRVLDAFGGFAIERVLAAEAEVRRRCVDFAALGADGAPCADPLRPEAHNLVVVDVLEAAPGHTRAGRWLGPATRALLEGPTRTWWSPTSVAEPLKDAPALRLGVPALRDDLGLYPGWMSRSSPGQPYRCAELEVMQSGSAPRAPRGRLRVVRAMIAGVCSVCLTLAWLGVPAAGLASGSGGAVPACAGPPPPPTKSQALGAALRSSGAGGAVLACGALPPPDHKPSTERQSAGAPFLTQTHAIARGDYALACAQLSKVVLRRGKARSLRAARRLCVRQLRAQVGDLDDGRLRSLASTRVVRVGVNHRRARVTVQTTLYGLKPRATGTAIREGGRWRIARPLSGLHVGRSLVEGIPSEGMFPTLRAGDTILLDQDAYLKAPPAIGDIVVFHPPAGADTNACAKAPPNGQACSTPDRRSSKKRFVKRIVAGPGDRISIRDGRVIRNGTLAFENFIQPCVNQVDGCDFPRTFTVAAGRYYVLGDNRESSDDSRFWGPVAPRSILGRVQRVGP